MFDNIGEKIKALATIECICGIIGSVLLGIVIMTEELLLGLAVAIVGSLASWLGSFVIYGFGDLVETNRRILSKLSSDEKESSFVPTPKILLSMQRASKRLKKLCRLQWFIVGDATAAEI